MMVDELHSKTLMDRQTGMINEEGELNLWDNEAVDYNGESNEIDLRNYPHISIIVAAFSDEENTNPANVTLEYLASPDGEFYTVCDTITEDLPQGGDNNAHKFYTIGSRYMKLRRADSDTDDPLYIKASVQAKS